MCKVVFIYSCDHESTTFSPDCRRDTALAVDIGLLGNCFHCDPSSKDRKVLMQYKIVQALVDGHNIKGNCEEVLGAGEKKWVHRQATFDKLKVRSDKDWAEDKGPSGREQHGGSPGSSSADGSTADDGGKGKGKANS